MYVFSKRSKERLETCDLRLQEIFNEVIKHADCSILEGFRGEERQEKLFKEGKTKAHFLESNHNFNPSRAVDVMPYPIDWDDFLKLHHFAGIVKGVAFNKGVAIKWGGEFKSFFDGPHFELKKD